MKDKLPFGFDTPQDSPGFLLWQTTLTWQRLIKKTLQPFDVSHAQFVIMALLMWLDGQGVETTQVHIVQWSKLDKMTVSKALKSLASLGYVTRTEHRQDTRAKSVKLTSSGRVLIQKLVPLVEKCDEAFFKGIKKGDQKNLMEFLKELIGDKGQ